MLCAALYTGDCKGWALFVGGAEVLELLEVMCCVLLYTLETVNGGLCSLEMLEVMGCVLLCMLKAVEDELYLLEVLEVPYVMRVCCFVCWRL